MRTKEREAAARKGEDRYFTGLACIHGHIALRRTESGACTECVKMWSKRRRAYIKDLLSRGGEK